MNSDGLGAVAAALTMVGESDLTDSDQAVVRLLLDTGMTWQEAAAYIYAGKSAAEVLKGLAPLSDRELAAVLAALQNGATEDQIQELLNDLRSENDPSSRL